ncbi:hypothetical protein [Phaeacidiphilus oryzae]|jgi:hypothetical protein|uniref:hypothetical protein n=1 Tax=Phaeacidiphilus oryzae TaxID=348818 RepID=UPI000B0EB3BB|nr:hypothetical protein [Phaeacidiphilus oryzae]
MNPSSALDLMAAPISDGSGPGMFLRIIVIVAVVGVVFLAVVLLRGYGGGDD